VTTVDETEEMVFPGYAVQDAIEYCFERGWTDGMPVVPCTEELLAPFLATTRRDPDEVLMEMAHLDRRCTVRRAAVNAVMAGCRPEYFPVVLAAWDSFRDYGMGRNALWQSTTGTAPFTLVNGPIAERIELNSKGNVFGSGFRANATIGRAIRLTVINAFGLRPRVLDQATQGTPAKYTCCIAENEQDSPWPAFHTDYGFGAEQSTVTAMVIRATLHIEARHTTVPEHLLLDFVDSIARTGSMVVAPGSTCLVFGPEHAHVLADAGWSKDDIKQFVYDNAVRTPEELDRVGKGAEATHTHWRLPVDHPDAVPVEGEREPLHTLVAPSAIQVLVAGAPNAGVSAILETFGFRRERPAITAIEE
jgi:hypothetical protein